MSEQTNGWKSAFFVLAVFSSLWFIASVVSLGGMYFQRSRMESAFARMSSELNDLRHENTQLKHENRRLFKDGLIPEVPSIEP